MTTATHADERFLPSWRSWRTGSAATVVRWGTGIGVSVLVLWGLATALRRSPLLAIEQVRAEGCAWLDPAGVVAWSGVPLGANLLSVDEEAVARRLERHPWIRKASVLKQFPRGLLLSVQERSPVGVLRGDEDLYYLDGEGVVVHRLRPGDPLDYPVISGLESVPWRVGRREEGRRIRQALALIDALGRSPGVGRVSEIRVEPSAGWSVFLEDLVPPVRMGWEGFPHRTRKLERAYPQLQARQEGIRGVDLRFGEQVVVQTN